MTTSSLHYDADGADIYGFPLSFYTKVSGYNVVRNEGSTTTDFNVLALIGNVVFAFIISYLILVKLTNSVKEITLSK